MARSLGLIVRQLSEKLTIREKTLAEPGVETQHHLWTYSNVVLLVDAIDEISTLNNSHYSHLFSVQYHQGSHLLISTRFPPQAIERPLRQFNHIEMYNRPESLREEFTQNL